MILLGQSLGDDALVTVAAGHLVTDLKLALHRDEDLDLLDHSGRQIVPQAQELDLRSWLTWSRTSTWDSAWRMIRRTLSSRAAFLSGNDSDLPDLEPSRALSAVSFLPFL